jgi:hypothetical protein
VDLHYIRCMNACAICIISLQEERTTFFTPPISVVLASSNTGQMPSCWEQE